jgi:C-terminal processing protease CtpA/Prc
MEVARQLEPSSSEYKGWVTKKFTLTAAAVVLAAAVFGGTVGSTKKLSSFASASAKNSYQVVDDIEKDYNEAVATITDNYSGDIDHEKATQAAIQGMLSTLDPHSSYLPYAEF